MEDTYEYFRSLSERCVDNGVMLLNHAAPGWQDSVNPETLDMDSKLDCILGQVYGGYGRGIEDLKIAGNRKAQVSLGFDLTADDYSNSDPEEFEEKMNILKQAWLNRL